MSDDAPANMPTWLRWAVPAFLLAVAVLLVIAHRAQWRPDWINVAAQLALAALLFWYVLETRRTANETRRLALQGEAQLALLREQDRQRLAPWVIAEVLNLVRYDDPKKNAAEYASDRGRKTFEHLINQPPGTPAGPAPHVEANSRQVRLRLEGENLAQQISVVLRYGALDSFQFKVPAVDTLSTSDRFEELELPAGWKKRHEVVDALTGRYGQFPMSVLPLRGTYVALIMRDALGRVLVTLRVFVGDDGEVVEHRRPRPFGIWRSRKDSSQDGEAESIFEDG